MSAQETLFEPELDIDIDFDLESEEVFNSSALLHPQPYSRIPLSSTSSSISSHTSTVAATSSVLEAIYHIICVIAGSGVLSLPFALSQCGWIGLTFIALTALINTYTGKLLVKCIYINPSQPLKSYAAIGYLAYGPFAKAAVDFCANLMMLGVTCVYLILAGMNFAEILGGSIRAWILFCGFLTLIPYLLFKTLKEVALLSLFGVLATMVVIGMVLYYSALDSGGGEKHYKVLDVWSVPIAFASISFSFSGNFIYPQGLMPSS